MFSLFKTFQREEHKIPLRITNTLSKQKEVFTPISGKQVKIYSCGPTVYSRAHIGNIRAYILPDILKRLLEHNGYNVSHVINITDVGHLTDDADQGEDKIELGARKEKLNVDELTEKYAAMFINNLKELNINTNEVFFPRATDYINEQIEIIKKLESAGHTYKTSDGIYFDISTFKKYGELGNIALDEDTVARIKENKEKRHKEDFALWKFGDKSRLQEWDSPWGVGFPGWHIECSAMAMKILGEQIDIHTGGIDHISVHHNNEIAQSESVSHKRFVKYWMHSGFLNIEGERIAKSVGNVFYLSDLEERGFDPVALKYLLLNVHYTSPLNFSFESLLGAHRALLNLRKRFDLLGEKIAKKPDTAYMREFVGSLSDDINTSKALAVLWNMLKDEDLNDNIKKKTALEMDKLLGIEIDKKLPPTPTSIEEKIEERDDYRAKKDFFNADRIRDEIENMGYKVEDSEYGSLAIPEPIHKQK